MRLSLGTAAALAALAAAQAACGAESGGRSPDASATRAPVEREAPNSAYRPAFEGQTRAAGLAPSPALDVTVIASDLETPWALEFLPDGRLLVTEKAGRLRIVSTAGGESVEVEGVPAVFSGGQGGLLDVAVDPDFVRTGRIFFSFAEPRGEGKNGTSLARARLVEGPTPRLEDVAVIFRQEPAWASSLHFGSRIVFASDGTLFLTVGERSVQSARVQAQDLGGHLGKVLRLTRDGAPAPGNPFIGRSGARPEIWSYGHRNIQSAALQPGTGRLWTIEHGPRGGDELNRPQGGKNYGWPVISYGIEYSGAKMPGGLTAKDGMEQPVYYWDPVIAPSGMTFYTGDLVPAWKGDVFVGGLATEMLVRLKLDGDRVIGEERLLTDLGKRIRDVVQGPDGALYLVTDARRGEVLRVAPR